MKMRYVIAKGSFALLTAMVAFSAGHAQTTGTIDTPAYSGSRTVTRDPAAGTLSRDTELMRKSDGAVATSSFDRQKTGTGVTASGSQTGFGGNTRSFDYARERTGNGVTATGTAIGRGGQTYNYDAARTRTADGYTNSRTVTNGAGETLYSRSATGSRAGGQITRDVSTTRAEGFRRPERARGMAPRRGRRG